MPLALAGIIFNLVVHRAWRASLIQEYPGDAEIVVRQYRPVITLSATGGFTRVEQFILPGFGARRS
jgi:hypothetical protein